MAHRREPKYARKALKSLKKGRTKAALAKLKKGVALKADPNRLELTRAGKETALSRAMKEVQDNLYAANQGIHAALRPKRRRGGNLRVQRKLRRRSKRS